jgi:hypothetical protein
MVRKLETGAYVLERDKKVQPVNRIRPIDAEAENRHDANKKSVFRRER